MKDFKLNYVIFLLMAAFVVTLLGYFSYSKYEESRLRGQLAAESHEQLKRIVLLRDNVQTLMRAKAPLENAGKKSDSTVAEMAQKKSQQLIADIISVTADSPDHRALAMEIKKNFQAFQIGLEKNQKKSIQRNHDLLMKNTYSFLESEGRYFRSKLNDLVQLNRNFYIIVVLGAFIAFGILMYMNYVLLMAQYREENLEKRIEEIQIKQARSFHATKDGFFEWNLQDNNVYWSPRLIEMIGYKEGEITASPEMLEQMMHSDDREGFWQDLYRHLRSETSEHSAIFRWQHKNGGWVWIHSRGRASFDKQGDPTELIGVHTDITQLKQGEIQLARAKEEAEQANNAKSDFMAHMSHEIRTPLTAITGVAEILNMQKGNFDERTAKLLSALNTSAITLRDLITDILDFSKIETGKIVLSREEINLREFFEEILPPLVEKAKEKNIDVKIRGNKIANININGDPYRLRQIMLNIVGNAIKFTSQGAITVSAFVKKDIGGEFLQIDVKDTGIGIAEAHMPYIFDSFRQADRSNTRKFGGTGLGLPISRKLAQLMGGDINAVSEVNNGSLFSVVLPLNNPSTDSKLNDVVQPKDFSLPIKDDEKILIVEDYEGNIAFITHILDEMNIKYDLGRTGAEGLKLWNGNKYKLILMDIQMPEMDGISALHHIRKAEKEKGIAPVPVIAMTAHAFFEDREKCLAEGFDEFLAKPLSKHSLYIVMQKLLA